MQHVKYEVRDGAAWLTLARPEARNAFSTRFYAEVREAVRMAEVAEGVSITVIQGSPEVFGTGGDLKEIGSYIAEDADPLDLYRFEDAVPFHAIRTTPNVVVSVVRGLCLGGGLVIACESDISIVAADARLGFPEARAGIADSYGSTVLAGRVGVAKAKYLLLTGATVDGLEAERIGLVTEAVPGARLDERVTEVLGELKRCSPGARSAYKSFVNRSIPRGDAADMWSVMRSAGGREGIRAFVEGRPPRFGGEDGD